MFVIFGRRASTHNGVPTMECSDNGTPKVVSTTLCQREQPKNAQARAVPTFMLPADEERITRRWQLLGYCLANAKDVVTIGHIARMPSDVWRGGVAKAAGRCFKSSFHTACGGNCRRVARSLHHAFQSLFAEA